MTKGGISIKVKVISLVVLAVVCMLLPSSAMAMSDSDKAIIQLTTFSVLDDTGDFNYVKAIVDDEDNLKIWYVPKETDTTATITTLGEVVGAYMGMTRSHPDMSDAYISIGVQGDEKGSLYCKRSWIPYGEMTNEEATALVLKVLGTFTAS
jgi:hypothetical protein